MAVPKASPQPHLTELTLDFLAYLELERGLSRNTLEAYRSDLLQFGAFLGRAGRDPLDGRRRPTWRRSSPSWPAGARDARRSPPATLQRKAACLRSFYRHLRREEMIDHDPTAELRPPRKPRPAAQGAEPRRGRAACWPSPRAARPPRCATARCWR